MSEIDGATPRPWRTFDSRYNVTEIMGADGPMVCEVFQAGGQREIDEAEANARLIVQAVNAHEALVAALTELDAYYDASGPIWERARAALKLATTTTEAEREG